MKTAAVRKEGGNPALVALGVVVAIVWFSGLAHVLAGMIAGALLVLGLMMTVERIPGFWPFAVTGFGTIVVLFGTGWLAHVMFGTSTALGMIAFVTSLIGKVAMIDEKKRSMRKA